MEGSISVLDVGRQVCSFLLCEEGLWSPGEEGLGNLQAPEA